MQAHVVRKLITGCLSSDALAESRRHRFFCEMVAVTGLLFYAMRSAALGARAADGRPEAVRRYFHYYISLSHAEALDNRKRQIAHVVPSFAQGEMGFHAGRQYLICTCPTFNQLSS
jgi:hypothetical protein